MTNPELQLLTGGYTDQGGEGIYALSYNPGRYQFGPLQLLAKTHHPSFGLQQGLFWYWVDETEDGQLLTYQKQAGGGFERVNQVSVGGASPCHLAVRDDGQFLAVSNYQSGNLAIWRLSAGIPDGQPQILQHEGCGPNQNRQEKPHAHWAGWVQLASGARGIYAIDLGVDTIFWYPQDATGTVLPAQVAWQAAPGDGPRHLACHPRQPWIYVINELSNTLSFTHRAVDGRLHEVQKITTLPADFSGESIAAHIQLNREGSRLYVSNRGCHSLAVFAIAEDGTLNLLQIIASGGAWPRFFVLLEAQQQLLVANQDSNNLVVFDVLADGRLRDSGVQAQVPRPTFVGVA